MTKAVGGSQTKWLEESPERRRRKKVDRQPASL